MSGLDAKTLLGGNAVFQEFKGALTEQFVLQQLKSMNNLRVFYWSAEKAEAQVDFILQAGGRIIPLEVKAEENLRAKSLTSYRERYSPALSIRASMSDHRQRTGCSIYRST